MGKSERKDKVLKGEENNNTNFFFYLSLILSRSSVYPKWINRKLDTETVATKSGRYGKILQCLPNPKDKFLSACSKYGSHFGFRII